MDVLVIGAAAGCAIAAREADREFAGAGAGGEWAVFCASASTTALHRQEELTGIARRDVDRVWELGIEVRRHHGTEPYGGPFCHRHQQARACSCFRPGGGASMAGSPAPWRTGTRPAGIFRHGPEIREPEGYMPGKRAVILGSGDIGLTGPAHDPQGAKVLACVELMPYSSGLNNIVQCLHDYDIPLLLSHYRGGYSWERLEGVTVARWTKTGAPFRTERRFDCNLCCRRGADPKTS